MASGTLPGQDTQYATHGLHTYVAAMIPALARTLIDAYVPRKGSVLDPFCGGGAVLVEAIRSGREAVGRDINDLAVLVSRAKTTHVRADEIRDGGARVSQGQKSTMGHHCAFQSPTSWNSGSKTTCSCP